MGFTMTDSQPRRRSDGTMLKVVLHIDREPGHFSRKLGKVTAAQYFARVKGMTLPVRAGHTVVGEIVDIALSQDGLRVEGIFVETQP